MAGTQSVTRRNRRVAVVFGGGGMKGFAHIGVVQALEERGIVPSIWGGTSIGALIAAAAVGGMSANEMVRRAEGIRRRDVFRINHFGMLLERMRSPSIYMEEPLRELCRSVAPDARFDELPTPLLVNTVDLERGTQIVWGLPGLRDVHVADAVYASCALPGYFPPGMVDGRVCVDGGVIDNLPASVASLNADVVIAVDVGSSDLEPVKEIATTGFASIYARAATTMMHALQQFPLTRWSGPPMLLIRPKVAQEWLSFESTSSNIAAGYAAASKALDHFETYADQPGGVYPRRRVELDVLNDRCIGCGLCVALAPQHMGMDSSGKAFPRTRVVEWSPADGDFVHHCPTEAIAVKKLERLVPPVLSESEKLGAA